MKYDSKFKLVRPDANPIRRWLAFSKSGLLFWGAIAAASFQYFVTIDSDYPVTSGLMLTGFFASLLLLVRFQLGYKVSIYPKHRYKDNAKYLAKDKGFNKATLNSTFTEGELSLFSLDDKTQDLVEAVMLYKELAEVNEVAAQTYSRIKEEAIERIDMMEDVKRQFEKTNKFVPAEEKQAVVEYCDKVCSEITNYKRHIVELMNGIRGERKIVMKDLSAPTVTIEAETYVEAKKELEAMDVNNIELDFEQVVGIHQQRVRTL